MTNSKKQTNYDFKSELLIIHKKDIVMADLELGQPIHSGRGMSMGFHHQFLMAGQCQAAAY